jgi:hypothetical protein
VIGPSPSERAEAVLLGQILADEERRAAGLPGGPRLLDQVRTWGITTAGLYGRGYHAEVWRRICDIAARGGTATRAEVAILLAREAHPAEPAEAAGDGEAPHPAAALMDGTRVHPEIAHPSHLIELTDAAEEAGTRPDRAAAMVVSGAIHRSAHTLSVEVDRAARGEPGGLAQAVTAARDKLARMGAAWARLPEDARTEVEAAHAAGRTPIQQAQAELAEIRSTVAELRSDPGHAERVAADPAWRLLDRIAGAIDWAANASVDAPRSPDAGDRVHLRPGQIIAGGGAWVEHYRRQAEAEEAEAPGPRGMVPLEEDRIAYAEHDAAEAAAEPERDAERADREARLLGSLVAIPDQAGEVDLAPDQLHDPRCRAVYEVMTDLRQSGVERVDRPLLEWAAQARGVDTSVISEPVVPREAAALAQTIATDAAADRVRTAVTTLRDLAIDPAVSPAELVASGAQALEAVGIDPPTLEPTLGEIHEPAADRGQAAERTEPQPEVEVEHQDHADPEPAPDRGPQEVPAARTEPDPADHDAQLRAREDAELDRRAAAMAARPDPQHEREEVIRCAS